jgi:hypothetical protein
VDSLPVRATEDLDDGARDFAVGCRCEKPQGMKAFLDPDKVYLFNNNRQEGLGVVAWLRHLCVVASIRVVAVRSYYETNIKTFGFC